MGVLVLPGLRCRTSPRSCGVVCMEGAKVDFRSRPPPQPISKKNETPVMCFLSTYYVMISCDRDVRTRHGCGQSRRAPTLVLIAPLIDSQRSAYHHQDAEQGRRREYIGALRGTYLARGKGRREMRPLKKRVRKTLLFRKYAAVGRIPTRWARAGQLLRACRAQQLAFLVDRPTYYSVQIVSFLACMRYAIYEENGHVTFNTTPHRWRSENGPHAKS